MTWLKRIFFFMLVNVLVVLTISITMNVLGVKPYLTAYGLDYESLLVFCLLWGMVGSFISLGISRIMAKFAMGVKVIDPSQATGVERDLVEIVHNLARSARLPKMPEVGIYTSAEVNAFATGPTKARSLVAVSSGLLQRMSRPEIEGVLGHEIAHIANGDMVTMTLLQGIVNAFVMFLARVIAFAISQSGRSDNEGRSSGGGMNYFVVMALEIALSFLGMIVIAAFSRWREFRADRGGAIFAGQGKMVAALQRLQASTELVDTSASPSVAALKISGKNGGLLALFASHPPLEERIARLKQFVPPSAQPIR